MIVTGAGPIGPAARRLLETPTENYPGGWGPPRETRLPTGSEFVTDYLEPRAAHPALAPHISIGHRITTATSIQDDGKGVDKTRSADRDEPPFLLRTGTAGNTTDIVARAVIGAPGTWHTPNPADRSGSEAISEAEARA